MQIQTVNSGTVVIYIDNTELREMDSDPDNIDFEAATAILRRTLGEKKWEDACLEVFPGREEVMIFARARASAPAFFEFSDIEPVIEAARLCPDGIISFFSHTEHGYILTVYPWHGDVLPGALYEFGDSVEHHPYYALHLAEQDCVIDGPTAIDTLKNAF